MKTMKLILAIVMISGFSSIMAQTAKPAATKMNYYFVMSTHTPEQCANNADELNKKGDAFVSKFYFGCHHGDHTCYAILQGTSEDAVRKSLPKNQQDIAKIMPVDKMTVAELQKSHKEMK
jgi:hypothetical protein